MDNSQSPENLVDKPKVKKVRKLGEAQVYALRMVNPEWITTTPDARSVRVLESLEARGLTYQNFGHWYISIEGKKALAEIDATDGRKCDIPQGTTVG